MNKLINKDQVAVVHSNDWGMGWSTRTRGPEAQRMMFDPQLAQLVLDNSPHAIIKQHLVKYYDYDADFEYLPELTVTWVSLGSEFVVLDYDGLESVMLKQDFDWITA